MSIDTNTITRHLKCVICNRLPSKPKSLPCLHMICQACELNLRAIPDVGGKMMCRLCSLTFPLSTILEPNPADQFVGNILVGISGEIFPVSDLSDACSVCWNGETFDFFTGPVTVVATETSDSAKESDIPPINSHQYLTESESRTQADRSGTSASKSTTKTESPSNNQTICPPIIENTRTSESPPQALTSVNFKGVECQAVEALVSTDKLERVECRTRKRHFHLALGSDLLQPISYSQTIPEFNQHSNPYPLIVLGNETQIQASQETSESESSGVTRIGGTFVAKLEADRQPLSDPQITPASEMQAQALPETFKLETHENKIQAQAPPNDLELGCIEIEITGGAHVAISELDSQSVSHPLTASGNKIQTKALSDSDDTEEGTAFEHNPVFSPETLSESEDQKQNLLDAFDINHPYSQLKSGISDLAPESNPQAIPPLQIVQEMLGRAPVPVNSSEILNSAECQAERRIYSDSTVDSLPEVEISFESLRDIDTQIHQLSNGILESHCTHPFQAVSKEPCKRDCICIDCAQAMCKPCAAKHSKMTSSMGHYVWVIGTTPNLAESVKSLQNIPKKYCREHDLREMKVYCETCEVSCCLVCLRNHGDHVCCDINLAAEQIRKKLIRCQSVFEIIKDLKSTMCIQSAVVKSDANGRRESKKGNASKQLVSILKNPPSDKRNVKGESKKDNKANLVSNGTHSDAVSTQCENEIYETWDHLGFFFKVVIDFGQKSEVLSYFERSFKSLLNVIVMKFPEIYHTDFQNTYPDIFLNKPPTLAAGKIFVIGYIVIFV